MHSKNTEVSREQPSSQIAKFFYNCSTGLHRKGILTTNKSKMRWEVCCDACGSVVEWWSFGTNRAPKPVRRVS